MSHAISALIARGPCDDRKAREYDLPSIALPQGYVLIPLDPMHFDHWEPRLGLPDEPQGAILLDCATTHFYVRETVPDRPYAIGLVSSIFP